MSAPGTRRWVGLGLAIYGGGSLLLIAYLMTVLVAPAGEDGLLGIEAQRRDLLAVVDASAEAIRNAETATRSIDGTLVSTSDAAGSASVFMGGLATTMSELATSLRVSILGTQPFLGPADEFDRVAAQAGRVAADLDLAAASIRQGATDMTALADQLASVGGEVADMRTSLARPLDDGAWRLFGALLLAWLAVPAAVSLVVGLRWWRPVGPSTRSGRRRGGG